MNTLKNIRPKSEGKNFWKIGALSKLKNDWVHSVGIKSERSHQAPVGAVGPQWLKWRILQQPAEAIITRSSADDRLISYPPAVSTFPFPSMDGKCPYWVIVSCSRSQIPAWYNAEGIKCTLAKGPPSEGDPPNKTESTGYLVQFPAQQAILHQPNYGLARVSGVKISNVTVPTFG